MTGVEYQPTSQEEMVFLVFLAQELFVRKTVAGDTLSMITWAEGNYGEVNFLNGKLHSAKIDLDFTPCGGELVQYYLELPPDNPPRQTSVTYPSFINRNNGVISAGEPEVQDLERFTSHLRRSQIKAIDEFGPTLPPRPEVSSKSRDLLTRYLGRVPLLSHH
jgi:hypothetical protein